jgi:hypothetical protein
VRLRGWDEDGMRFVGRRHNSEGWPEDVGIHTLPKKVRMEPPQSNH